MAQKLAIRLDYGLFGREIVDQISAEEGVSKRLVADLDEHVENAIERHVIDNFRRQNFTESDYLRDAMRIVSTLGMRGRTIVLGRGSACILPAATTLRVLVVAPTEWRRDRLARIRGVSAEEAEKTLAREDAGRAAFWKHNFNVDHSDPVLYDVVMNSAMLGIDGVVDLVAQAFRLRFPSTG
jgi:cytidylate kinase